MTTIKITTVVLAMLNYVSVEAARVRIPVPYGTEEKIIKVLDLPDTEYFKLKDGSYFDIGSKYTKSHLVWLSYSNTEPQIVGYVANGDTYLELSAEQLLEIEENANVSIPKTGSISFFDKYVGKGVFGLLGLLILYGIYNSIFNKDEDEEEEKQVQTAQS